MFLISTLRWATALSTVNCWLSEVIRLTWVVMAYNEIAGDGVGLVRRTAVVESKLESASFVAPFILALFHLPPPLNHRCEMSFFGLSSGLFRACPARILRKPRPRKLTRALQTVPRNLSNSLIMYLGKSELPQNALGASPATMAAPQDGDLASKSLQVKRRSII